MTLAVGVIREAYSHVLNGILQSSCPVTALLDKRLLLVMGKGGTGKTTISAALGLAAARRGRRTVVVEVAEQERLARLFGKRGGAHDEVELAPGLFGLSVDPRRAMDEWLRHQLRSGTLAGLLGGSRIFQLLTAAAPGVSELVTMGKIWDLAQLERRTGGSVFDLAIVDAPATGHGLALLNAPGTYARIARAGPVAKQGRAIDAFTRDRRFTGIVAAALPEEMPVVETLELEDRLARDSLALDAIVVNALRPERFEPDEVDRLESLDGRGTPAARAALAAALAEHRRAAGQRAQLERLLEEADAAVATLPHLFVPELGRAELEALSELLEAAL
jgi:anion-transporting  ArsA/GET3 family ATPase